MTTGYLLIHLLALLSATALAVPRQVNIMDEPFGALPDDRMDDTAAIQAAIDAVGEGGGTVVIPPGTFEVSTAKGITVEGERVRLLIQGDLHVTTDGLESQDCTNLFTVTGARCEFIGAGGMIYGDGKPFKGEKATRNVHRVIILPKLIYFTTPADQGVVRDLVMRDPPGGFVGFIGVNDCRLTGCRLEGGAPENVKEEGARAVSYYLGVTIISTHGQIIQGNHFGFYEGRGMFSWVSGSGSGRHESSVISGNVFEGGYDHAIYISGLAKSVVANNTVRDSVATAIKLIGNDLIVTGNHITNCRYGGISTRNGSRNIIANNTINGYGHRAISITPYGGSNREAYTDNIIRGNILIGLTGEDAPPVMAGVCIWSHQHASRCKIEGNIIHNAGSGNPALSDERPGEAAIIVRGAEPSDGVSIIGNTIHQGHSDGIVVDRLRGSVIRDNVIDTEGEPVVSREGADNLIEHNRSPGKD